MSAIPRVIVRTGEGMVVGEMLSPRVFPNVEDRVRAIMREIGGGGRGEREEVPVFAPLFKGPPPEGPPPTRRSTQVVTGPPTGEGVGVGQPRFVHPPATGLARAPPRPPIRITFPTTPIRPSPPPIFVREGPPRRVRRVVRRRPGPTRMSYQEEAGIVVAEEVAAEEAAAAKAATAAEATTAEKVALTPAEEVATAEKAAPLPSEEVPVAKATASSILRKIAPTAAFAAISLAPFLLLSAAGGVSTLSAPSGGVPTAPGTTVFLEGGTFQSMQVQALINNRATAQQVPAEPGKLYLFTYGVKGANQDAAIKTLRSVASQLHQNGFTVTFYYFTDKQLVIQARSSATAYGIPWGIILGAVAAIAIAVGLYYGIQMFFSELAVGITAPFKSPAAAASTLLLLGGIAAIALGTFYVLGKRPEVGAGAREAFRITREEVFPTVGAAARGAAGAAGRAAGYVAERIPRVRELPPPPPEV